MKKWTKMKNPIVKRLLPHLIAVVVFVLISVVYFFPAFDGYRLKQGDVTHYRGMAQEISEFRKMYGEDPLWTNAMFGGMPAYQISVDYPNDIVRTLDLALTLGLPRPANYLFLYLLGFYILMISLRVKPALAAIASVAFAFSSYYFVILEAGHNTKAHAIGYMAPVLAGIVWAFRGRILFGSAIAALFLALEIGANHVQITYYLAFPVLFMAIAYAVRAYQKGTMATFFKASGALLIAAVIAVAANLNNLWPTYEYGNYSTRGKTELTIKPDGTSNDDIVTEGLDREYVTQWSYGIDETLTMLVPNFMGGESGALIDQNTQRDNPQLYRDMAQGYQTTQVFPNTYWGDQPFTSGPVYVGAIVVLLFFLGLFFVKTQLRWAILASVILTVALSWGKNFMGLTDFFLDVVPGYDKFRAVTIILSITGLLIPILGFLFLKRVMANPKVISEKRNLFFGVTGFLGLLLILFAATPTTFFNFLSTQENEIFTQLSESENADAVFAYVVALQEARADLFSADAIRSLIFIALAAGLIWFFAMGKVKEQVFLGILGVLVIADLYPISKRYLNNQKEKGRYVQWEPAESATSAYTMAAADEYILQREMEMNPRVTDAVNTSVSNLRAEVKKDTKRRANQDEINDVKFAALRFNTTYRVLNLNQTFQDARTSYFHQSVGGYHGAKLKRIQELYDFHIVPEISSLTGALQSNPTAESLDKTIQDMDVSNMLNSKYIIYNPQAPPFENEYAYGPACFVEYIQTSETADEEILALDELDLRAEAAVHEDFSDMVESFSFRESADAAIAVEEHLPNYIKYIYDSPVEQAVIFSEIYYPSGWNAYIDGEKTDYFRANYLLRGMIVPEGNHTIEFKFEPATFSTASTVSTIAGFVVIILLAISIFRNYKAPEQDDYEEMYDT